MVRRLNARGLLFLVLAFLSAFLGSIFLLFPFLPLAILAPKVFRIAADRLVGYWLTFPASLCERLFGVRFHITGDKIDRSRAALILMNHPTRLDWLFLWNALYKMDPWLLTSEKISLKAPLKLIPGAGWAMGCDAFFFLRRKLDLDLEMLRSMVGYLRAMGRPYQLLLFPEGTDRSDWAVGRSDAFAQANGLPKYKYCLHPRTAGFATLLELFRKDNYLKDVYDVSIAYPKGAVTNELEIIEDGRMPHEVHFHVHRFSADELPESQDDVETWLKNLWVEKERRLGDAHKEGYFAAEKEDYKWLVETEGFGYTAAFAVWCALCVFWLYSIYYYYWIKIYVIVASVFFASVTKFYGGVELLIAQMAKIHENGIL